MYRIFIVLSIFALGCGNPTSPDKENAEAPALPACEENTSSFEMRLLEIAKEYETYGRREAEMHFVPLPCSNVVGQGIVFFLPANSIAPQFSNSTDSTTHGRKLYSLFVKHVPTDSESKQYIETGKTNPIGQVVVKESWISEELKDEGRVFPTVSKKVQVRRNNELVEIDDIFYPYAKRGEKLYRAMAKGTLFIMYKTDPNTPGTDEGWVYGTVSADGKQVTSAGKVESCMNCHLKAPHDRLFGLAKR